MRVRSAGKGAWPVSIISQILATRQAEYVTLGVGGKKNWVEMGSSSPASLAGEAVVADGAVEHQEGRLEAVVVLNEVRGRLFDELGQLAVAQQVLGATVFIGLAARRVAAREGGV